jgi:hypothetical protein
VKGARVVMRRATWGGQRALCGQLRGQPRGGGAAAGRHEVRAVAVYMNEVSRQAIAIAVGD